MRRHISPWHLFILVLLLSVLLAVIQVGAFTIAFYKLGLSQDSAILLLVCSLLGSVINLPLFSIEANASQAVPLPFYLRVLLRVPPKPFAGKTLIAANVGGCVIPVSFSFYLLFSADLPFITSIIAIGLCSLVCYSFSRPIAGLGIGMPFLIAPLCAALLGLFLLPEKSAALAYVCGTLGVLIGADLLRLKDIRNMGTPLASIGGAGTFDGIFLTGFIAVLLA